MGMKARARVLAARKLHCIALSWKITWVYPSALEHREKRFLFGQHGLGLWDYWWGNCLWRMRRVREDAGPGRVLAACIKNILTKDLFKKRNGINHFHRQLLVGSGTNYILHSIPDSSNSLGINNKVCRLLPARTYEGGCPGVIFYQLVFVFRIQENASQIYTMEA